MNIPASTVNPCRSAISAAAVAHGPSSGSASGPSGTPKRAIVASGNTASSAPRVAARAANSATWSRLAFGSGVDVNWHNAIRTA